MTPDLLVVDASALVEFLLRTERGRAIGSLPTVPEADLHIPDLVRRIFELRNDFTPYDGAYVSLAEGLDASFLSGDDRLVRAVRRWTTVEPAEG